MIRTRHRLLAFVAAAVALTVATEASAQSTLLQLAYSNAKTFGNVHIAGGAIDITNGGMIVTTSSFGFVPSGGQANEYGAPGVAEYGDNAIHDALAEGANYSGGFWNGTNGITSSNAANNGATNTAIGWVDNSIGAYSTFRGVPVGPGQSIIQYTYFGDADLSGSVDTSDYLLWSAGLGNPVGIYGGKPEWVDGDWDQSGTVDTSDYLLWSATLGLPSLYTPAPIVPGASGAVGVPEPGSVLLLGLASLCALGYKYVPRFRI
jgi:hypothetical protein